MGPSGKRVTTLRLLVDRRRLTGVIIGTKIKAASSGMPAVPARHATMLSAWGPRWKRTRCHFDQPSPKKTGQLEFILSCSLIAMLGARRLAVGLNLFYNFQTDFRRFTNFEVTYTYVYILAFMATTVLFGLRFFESTHLAFHCHQHPQFDDICPTEFSLCACHGRPLVTDVCNGTDWAFDACTCCAYVKMELQTGVLRFLTHIGGLWTFSMGVSIVLLAMARLAILGPVDRVVDPADVTVEINALGKSTADV